jgi:hypothetical protein
VLTFWRSRASAHRYLIKYLATYSEAEPLGDAIEHAKIAAVEAIKLVEAVETDNLLDLPAIKQLQQTDPLLYRLLELYSREALEAFHAFHKENPDFLASAGMSDLKILCPLFIPRSQGSCLKTVSRT